MTGSRARKTVKRSMKNRSLLLLNWSTIRLALSRIFKDSVRFKFLSTLDAKGTKKALLNWLQVFKEFFFKYFVLSELQAD